MTEKLSPRIAAALADLQSAIDAEAVPNVMVLISLAPGRGHAYYSSCTCMQCTMNNIRSAARVMQDYRETEGKPDINALAVAAAGQVH